MKKIFLFIIIILISISAIGQTQLKENKTFYIGIDSKIYFNKDLPLHIRLVLPNGDQIQLQDSFYLDTEGVNYLRTRWEVDSKGNYILPKKEKLWNIYADNNPPKTTIEFIATNTYIFRGKTYYSDDLKAKLTASDELSGVKRIYYSINGESFLKYNKMINFKKETDINLKFYAVDNVGNIEDIDEISYEYDKNNLNFFIDNTPPVTNIHNFDTILSKNDTIYFTATDIGVGVNSIFYKLDSNSFVSTKKYISLHSLEDGYHNLKYYALDWINNKENIHELNFYYDKKPPEIKLIETLIEDELTNLRKVEIICVDNKAGVDKIFVQVKPTEEFKHYTKPFFIDISFDEIKIKAIDKKGNTVVRIIKYRIK